VLTLCAASVCLHDVGKKEYELFEMGHIVSTLNVTVFHVFIYVPYEILLQLKPHIDLFHLHSLVASKFLLSNKQRWVKDKEGPSIRVLQPPSSVPDYDQSDKSAIPHFVMDARQCHKVVTASPVVCGNCLLHHTFF